MDKANGPRKDPRTERPASAGLDWRLQGALLLSLLSSQGPKRTSA